MRLDDLVLKSFKVGKVLKDQVRRPPSFCSSRLPFRSALRRTHRRCIADGSAAPAS